MSQHLQAIATLFSLVNPLVCAMMFAGIVRGQSHAAAMRSATGAILSVAAVLVLTAFVGSPLLKLFGISLDAFSVAGGGVLIFIGISMMQGAGTPTASADPGATPNIGKLVLFAASPGTITGVITLTAAHRSGSIPVTALVAIALVLGVTWILLVATSKRPQPDHQSLAHDMVSRYMGLIIIAMGIQFALTGFRSFMAGG